MPIGRFRRRPLPLVLTPPSGAEHSTGEQLHERPARSLARKAAIAILVVPAVAWLMHAFPKSVAESMRDEVKFFAGEEALQRVETSIRDLGLHTLAGCSLVDPEPAQHREVHVYYDTGDFHLLNQATALYHVFAADPAPIQSGWQYYRILDRTKLWRRQLQGTRQPGLDADSSPGTAILERIRSVGYEQAIADRMEEDLGWLPDLEPRVLLGLTRKEWEYRNPASGRRLSLEITSVRASWWTGGTAGELDELAALRDVPEAPLSISWQELEIVEKDAERTTGNLLSELEGFCESYGVCAAMIPEPTYRHAVKLLSD